MLHLFSTSSWPRSEGSAFAQRNDATDKDFKRYYDSYANQKLKEQIAQECSGSFLWGTYSTQRLCSSKVIKSFMGAKDI